MREMDRDQIAVDALDHAINAIQSYRSQCTAEHSVAITELTTLLGTFAPIDENDPIPAAIEARLGKLIQQRDFTKSVVDQVMVLIQDKRKDARVSRLFE